MFQNLNADCEVIGGVGDPPEEDRSVRSYYSIICKLPQGVPVTLPSLDPVDTPTPLRMILTQFPGIVQMLAKQDTPMPVPATDIEHGTRIEPANEAEDWTHQVGTTCWHRLAPRVRA
jgi:hypothetical protein